MVKPDSWAPSNLWTQCRQMCLYPGLHAPGAPGPPGHPSLLTWSSYDPPRALIPPDLAIPRVLRLLGLCSHSSLSLKFPSPLLPGLTHPQHDLFHGAVPDLLGRIKLSHLGPPPHTHSWLTTSLCLLLCSVAIVSCLCTCSPHQLSSHLRASPPPQPPLHPRCSGPEPIAGHIRGQVEGSVLGLVALGALGRQTLARIFPA